MHASYRMVILEPQLPDLAYASFYQLPPLPYSNYKITTTMMTKIHNGKKQIQKNYFHPLRKDTQFFSIQLFSLCCVAKNTGKKNQLDLVLLPILPQ